MPASLEDLGRCKTNYIELDGWEENICDITDFKKLPRNA